MNKKYLGLSILLAALILPGLLISADDDDRPKSDDVATDVPREQIQPLGKTIKLEFKLIGEDEQPSFFVLCAARNYRIEHDESGPEFEHYIKFTGEVHAVDAKNRIFVTFKAEMHHTNQNEDFDATFSSVGSVLLTLDKKTTITRLGEQPLTLTATVEE